MIFNFGSINIDHVYTVPHLPGPGETLTANAVNRFLGGKGINQSIAVAKAQAAITHIGAVGPDGAWALEKIIEHGVSTSHIANVEEPTGHAIINVDSDGENAIVILSGANACLSESQLEAACANSVPDDWFLLQNETNLGPQIVRQGKEAGCRVAYSAAPFVAEITTELLPHTDLLCVNEGEVKSLASMLGCDVPDIPVPLLLVTLGSKGAFLRTQSGTLRQSAFDVKPVDTTGAGDTFLGSFLGRLSAGDGEETALEYAAAASALQVTRAGAASAIPSHDEVIRFIDEQGGS